MDAVFFDFDDTIYPQSQPFVRAFEQVMRPNPALAGHDGLDLEELFKAFRRHSDEMFAASERGDISMDDMYAQRLIRAFEDFGITISRDLALELQRVYAHYEEYGISMSGTMRSILSLVVERSKAGIVSNGPYEHQLRKMRTIGLGAWIPDERILISGGLDVAKPEPEIFLRACATVGSVPERCLYVGDSFEFDVRGPASAGMPCVWFNHRHHPQPAEPVPTWIVHTEQGLYDLLKQVL